MSDCVRSGSVCIGSAGEVKSLLLSPALTFLQVTVVRWLSITAAGRSRFTWPQVRWRAEYYEVAHGGAGVPLVPSQLVRGLQGLNQIPPGGLIWTPALRANHACQELRQLGDVDLRHLEGVILGQLPLVFQGGDDAPQLVERLVQAVHPPPLPGVGRDAPVSLGAEVAHRAALWRLVGVRLCGGGHAVGEFTHGRKFVQREVCVPPGERVQRAGGYPCLGVDVGQVALMLQQAEVLRVLRPAWKLCLCSHHCNVPMWCWCWCWWRTAGWGHREDSGWCPGLWSALHCCASTLYSHLGVTPSSPDSPAASGGSSQSHRPLWPRQGTIRQSSTGFFSSSSSSFTHCAL